MSQYNLNGFRCYGCGEYFKPPVIKVRSWFGQRRYICESCFRPRTLEERLIMEEGIDQ